jgi:hypothetical protein
LRSNPSGELYVSVERPVPEPTKKQMCDDLELQALALALENAKMTVAAVELEQQGQEVAAMVLRDMVRHNEVERIKLLAQASALGC